MTILNDYLSNVPSYESIIESYDLGVLRGGRDLQLTDQGDIALTADGDLQLGDIKHNAMHRLTVRWCFNEPTLRLLFDISASARLLQNRANAERDGMASIAFAAPDLTDQFHGLGAIVGSGEYGAAACAGALMVVLSNLMLRYKDDLAATKQAWEQSKPLFEGYSFGAAIVAAANNFRHHDEWARTNPPTQIQSQSIKVLIAVLNQNINNLKFRENVCADVTDAIGNGSFNNLAQNLFCFAKNLAN